MKNRGFNHGVLYQRSQNRHNQDAYHYLLLLYISQTLKLINTTTVNSNKPIEGQ
ncbi:hypothetical protein [Salisediminibacterium halotolerans]|uniref:hypothetical protein n=1 Tax=Salisediminibacterium halotolerans TaxID=517425 RepID=UPI001649AC8B|nr:hypothetical protein [Salisediminibacterium halotolerans]